MRCRYHGVRIWEDQIALNLVTSHKGLIGRDLYFNENWLCPVYLMNFISIFFGYFFLSVHISQKIVK